MSRAVSISGTQNALSQIAGKEAENTSALREHAVINSHYSHHITRNFLNYEYPLPVRAHFHSSWKKLSSAERENARILEGTIGSANKLNEFATYFLNPSRIETLKAAQAAHVKAKIDFMRSRPWVLSRFIDYIKATRLVLTEYSARGGPDKEVVNIAHDMERKLTLIEIKLTSPTRRASNRSAIAAARTSALINTTPKPDAYAPAPALSNLTNAQLATLPREPNDHLPLVNPISRAFTRLRDLDETLHWLSQPLRGQENADIIQRGHLEKELSYLDADKIDFQKFFASPEKNEATPRQIEAMKIYIARADKGIQDSRDVWAQFCEKCAEVWGETDPSLAVLYPESARPSYHPHPRIPAPVA